MDFFDSLIQSQSASRQAISNRAQQVLFQDLHSLTRSDGCRLSNLLVKHSSEKSCWVALPPALINKLYEASPALPLVLELRSTSHGGRAAGPAQTWHVAWAGSSSQGPHMDVPAALASCLGIAQGLTVSVKALPDVPQAIGICVEPVSTDDWEVVEQNAGYMEEQILNQVGVVQVGEAIPFWVRHQTMLQMKVSTALPAALVRLAVGAEVAIAPRPRRTLAQQHALESSDVQAAADATTDEVADHPDTCLRLQGSCSATVRLQHAASGTDEASISGMDGLTPCTTCAYISPQTAKQALLADSDLVLVSKHQSRSSKHVLSVRVSNKVAVGHAMLLEPVLASLQLQQHGRLQLQSISTATQIQPKSLVLHPIASSTGTLPASSIDQQNVKQALAAWLAAQAANATSNSDSNTDEHVPLQTGTVVQFLPDATASVQATGHAAFELELKCAPSIKQPPGASYALLAAADLASSSAASISIGSVVRPPEWCGAGQSKEAPENQRQQHAAMLSSSEALYKAAQTSLQRLIPLLAFPCRAALQELSCPCPGGLLISGPPGCGKTGLANLVAHTLQHHRQTLTHTVMVNCQDAASDNPANIMKHLIPKVQEALDCLPSLLILDDLHLICPTQAEGPEGPGTNTSAALVEWLCDVIDSFHPPGKPALPVAVLATCNDVAQLAPPVRAPGCLDHTLLLPAPGASERTSMLASHLTSRGATYALQDLQEVASQAEGYDAADLRVLVDRALHAAARRQLSRPLPGPLPAAAIPALIHPAAHTLSAAAGGGSTVSAADFAKAREGFQPAAAWGVGQLQGGQGGVEGWQDVGGLAEVRAALQEALELPTKYAHLISRAPLRLRTGVLLYGPPGCGKTHIVAAAVAAAGMRFVSVKGPEVLNKYIGASEAAVRDLFRRASAAAPCVLFFDEFDAIAPQRGHDSTGVTDRVVNQLLTELDGVEGLTGVCVLAATSRPDLLDAALLRPGRLDRLIHCGFPTAPERGEIITALARRLRLEGSVDLQGVGERAEGYTGADLSALLSEAQLAAVHERLEETSLQDSSPQNEQGTPVITVRHIEEALTKARPSVPPAEKRRLEAIYAKFSNNRDPNIGGGGDHKGKGKQLATLA